MSIGTEWRLPPSLNRPDGRQGYGGQRKLRRTGRKGGAPPFVNGGVDKLDYMLTVKF